MWNHRVIRSKDGDFVCYEICEVYYTKAGRINGWTAPTGPYGETLKELRTDLKHFIAALKKPVLE